MKHNIFETRQRTEELLGEAMKIWKDSDKAEYLENLKDDPVFLMLFSTLAYQANEFDSAMEQLKVDILDEFSQMLFVGEAGKAVPATIAIETALKDDVPYMNINSDVSFSISGEANKSFNFIPVLKTRALNARVEEINRLDGRRWLLKLRLADGVNNLSGMTLSIDNPYFHGLHITDVNSGVELPLIAPWEYTNLPMSDAFSLETFMYNRKQAVNTTDGHSGMLPYATNLGMDMFARQGVKVFVIDQMDDISNDGTLSLQLELDSIGKDFAVDINSIHLNVVLLANAQISTATISETNPITRIAGSGASTAENGAEQFLHLMHPGDEQMYGYMPLQVRRVRADRFNRGRMLKLLSYLIDRYYSDYYAFQEFGNRNTDLVMFKMRQGLEKLQEMSGNDQNRSYEGVYLMINRSMGRGKTTAENQGMSLSIQYLTTNGSDVNCLAGQELKVAGNQFLDAAATHAISLLQEGYDEVYDGEAIQSARRYFLATEDRLVTLADVKMFCMNELYIRYGLVRDMIKGIRVKHETMDMGTLHTYQVAVKIDITNNVFTQRAFADKIILVESYLARMIEVRMSGIYPVSVQLELK